MSKRDIFQETMPEVYVSAQSGRTMTRGTDKDFTTNGNPLQGLWVLKDKSGSFIDFNRYRNDLAEAHKFTLVGAARASLNK